MATSYLDMMSHDEDQVRKTAEYIRRHRTWFIALGVALIVLGIVAADWRFLQPMPLCSFCRASCSWAASSASSLPSARVSGQVLCCWPFRGRSTL